MKKLNIILIFAFIFFIALFLFYIKNFSNKPKDVINKYLNGYISLNEDISNNINNLSIDGLSLEELDLYKKILKREYSSLTYKITKVKRNKNNATIYVDLYVYDLCSAINESKKYAMMNIKEFYNENNIFDNTKYKLYKLKKMLKYNSKVIKKTYFNLIKKDNNWIINEYDESFYDKVSGIYCD